jgi:hypothetical protein
MKTKYYHGSPLILDCVKSGCDITPNKTLAEAFSHKPTRLSIDDNGIIYHNGTTKGYLYEVDEELLVGVDIIQHPNSAFTDGDEMLVLRDLKLKLIEN